MAIRSDSWGSVDEVEAVTPYALRGESDFSVTTLPTLAQVEKFIDRASGVLNNALIGEGFTPATIAANSTATLLCDDWVVTKAAGMVQLAQPGASFDETDMSSNIAGLYDDACKFVKSASRGFKLAGISVSDPASQGLAFTGIKKHSERSDPDNTTREQPVFRRHQFDNAIGVDSSETNSS